MFYAKLDRKINLNGSKQTDASKLEKEFGIKSGIHFIDNSIIKGVLGEVRYWDYMHLFEQLPTFRSNWNIFSPIFVVSEEEKYTNMDLFQENGLFIGEFAEVRLHEVKDLSKKEDGAYLLLCSDGDFFFQVITSLK